MEFLDPKGCRAWILNTAGSGFPATGRGSGEWLKEAALSHFSDIKGRKEKKKKTR